MDNPPVNQLSDHFTAEIAEAIAGAFTIRSEAIVLTGTEETSLRSRPQGDL
jgi:hypothetical protein